MARLKKVDMPRPELNITAMMDLVLNLITFFVLVANFAVNSLPGIEPPSPDKSVAKVEEAANRITVSVLEHPEFKAHAGEMVVGIKKVVAGDIAGMAALVQQEVQISPNVEVHLRADKRIRYSDIEPIMRAVASTGVAKFHMVAIAAEE